MSWPNRPHTAVHVTYGTSEPATAGAVPLLPGTRCGNPSLVDAGMLPYMERLGGYPSLPDTLLRSVGSDSGCLRYNCPWHGALRGAGAILMPGTPEVASAPVPFLSPSCVSPIVNYLLVPTRYYDYIYIYMMMIYIYMYIYSDIYCCHMSCTGSHVHIPF